MFVREEAFLKALVGRRNGGKRQGAAGSGRERQPLRRRYAASSCTPRLSLPFRYSVCAGRRSPPWASPVSLAGFRRSTTSLQISFAKTTTDRAVGRRRETLRSSSGDAALSIVVAPTRSISKRSFISSRKSLPNTCMMFPLFTVRHSFARSPRRKRACGSSRPGRPITGCPFTATRRLRAAGEPPFLEYLLVQCPEVLGRDR